jgi:hypothetical protein
MEKEHFHVIGISPTTGGRKTLACQSDAATQYF